MGAQRFRREAEFARFPGHVDLQQHLGALAILGRHPLNLSRQVERVEAVKQLEEREGRANLILLQVPNEVPMQPGGQQRNFRARLLNPALAKDGLTRIGGLAHGLGRMRLGDGDQFDHRGIASRRGGTLVNGPANGSQGLRWRK